MKIMLCGRPNACCPELTIEGDQVQIEDDYGNTVHMTKDQLKVLQSAEV